MERPPDQTSSSPAPIYIRSRDDGTWAGLEAGYGSFWTRYFGSLRPSTTNVAVVLAFATLGYLATRLEAPGGLLALVLVFALGAMALARSGEGHAKSQEGSIDRKVDTPNAPDPP